MKKFSKTNLEVLLFLAAIVLYYSQGIFYKTGSLISFFMLLFILIIGVKYLLKTLLIKQKLDNFVILWVFFLFLNILSFIFSSDFNNSIHLAMIKNIITSLLVFFPVFHWARSRVINDKIIKYFLLVFLPIAVMLFINNKKLLIYEYNRENIVNNVGYLFIAIFPYIMFIRNKIISFLIIVLIGVLVLLSAKRGAILNFVFVMAIYLYYIFFKLKAESQLLVIWKFIIFTIAGVALAYLLADLLEDNMFVVDRVLSGESRREENYQQIFNTWYNSNDFFKLLFGFGFASSIEMNSENVLAHNDWLEILSNFGLFGVTLYSLLIISFIGIIQRYKALLYKYTLIIIIASWLVTSSFSMWYNEINSAIQIILMAYIIGRYQENKNFVN